MGLGQASRMALYAYRGAVSLLGDIVGAGLRAGMISMGALGIIRRLPGCAGSGWRSQQCRVPRRPRRAPPRTASTGAAAPASW
jgi:hypothetical protein